MSEFFANLGIPELSTVLYAVIVFVVCLIVIKLILKAATSLISKSKKMDGVLSGFIQTALKIVLWVIAIIIIAGTLGIPTASLVAVISIAGLALSLSVQNIMANLFSGITLLITEPFRAGDLVDIGADTGVIKSVGLFYTVIDTLDNRVVSIPNSTVTGASVVNYSREPLRRVDMTFNVSYTSDQDAVRAAILETAQQDSKVLADPAPFIVIGAYKESTVEYIVRLWCKNADYWDVYFGMNERIRGNFAKHGVEMSFGHVNVHVIQ